MRALISLLALPFAASAGQPVFIDASSALPVAHVYDGEWEHFVGGGVSVFDCNGDEKPDIFVAGGANPSRLFVNSTEKVGAPFAFRMGDLAQLTGVTGAYSLDIDSDGYLDLYVLRAGENVVLKGDDDCKFSDVTEEWRLQSDDSWSTAFSATWETGQIWPTLAVGNYVDRDDPDGPFGACDSNLIYRHNGQHYEPPIELQPSYCALSMLFSDWRRNGRPELRVSNDRHYYGKQGYEQMWMMHPLRERGPNDGWQPFSIWGMGIASRDLNGDGHPEVMLSSMGDQVLQFAVDGRYDTASYNVGATAHRPHVGDDLRPSTGWHSVFGDVDNDGLADLFIAKGNVDQMPDAAMRDPDNLLMGQPDGTFKEFAATAGIASTDRGRGAALADFDGDGRQDLIVVNRGAEVLIWRNVTGDAGNWSAIDVRQKGFNARAVGAWVEVLTPDGRFQSQEITVGGGHAGGVSTPQHFGLGTNETAEVRIIWPDGKAGDWRELLINRTTVIERFAQ